MQAYIFLEQNGTGSNSEDYMKKIYLNLKRFDIPKAQDGINHLAPMNEWAETIIRFIEKMEKDNITVFVPEMHLMQAKNIAEHVHIGAQSFHYKDVKKGVNFGALTTHRTASSLTAIGVKDVLIGHLEERISLEEINDLAQGKLDPNIILNMKLKLASEHQMNILYCIGEKSHEQDIKYDVLKHQLDIGLKNVDLSKVTIAYEPVWAIGVGKTPPTQAYIEDITRYIKSLYDVPVVYGGGLKLENASMLGSIKELDGGLIALTRFGQDFGFYLEDFNDIVEAYLKEVKQ